MPHIVELDLTPSGFRQFYCAEDEPAAAKAPAHWLLSAVYGRDLLKAKLRKERPVLNVPSWRHGADLDPHLECMVDSLGLRDWVQPATVAARVRYLKFVLSLMVAVENGKPIHPLPL